MADDCAQKHIDQLTSEFVVFEAKTGKGGFEVDEVNENVVFRARRNAPLLRRTGM